MRFLRRLGFLIRARRHDDELAEELELHRDMVRQELERKGLTAAQAATLARRRVGNASLARDDARDAWGWSWLTDVVQDVRFASRLLIKDPRFTLTVVVALGLAIGVNNSVFTVINTALIRDVPFEQPERLLDVSVPGPNGREIGMAYAEYREWSEARTLEGISVSVDSIMNLSEETRAPARLRGTFVSANTFGVLRARPVIGRDFLPEDDRPGAPPVVIIGYKVWANRYGADPGIIGTEVRIDNAVATVVGVMPRSFSYPFIAEAWQPLSAWRRLEPANRTARPFRNVVARMSPGSDLASVQAELTALAANQAAALPKPLADVRPSVQPMRDGVGGRSQAKPILLTFMGAVGLVLLIACANVANLLLVRAMSRAREMAVRASLGATRWRIVRQLLIECLMLAIPAGALGLLLSFYGARTLATGFSIIEPGVEAGELMPFWVDLSPDKVVLGFVGTACLISTLAFGLVPAIQAARMNVNGALKEGDRGAVGGPRARRWTSVFIVSEVALTVVLLVGAGLLWRSFYVKYQTDLIIDPAGLVTARLTLDGDRYDAPDRRRTFVEALEARLAGLPGVSAVAMASQAPLIPGGAARQLTVEGHETADGVEAPSVSCVYTGVGYFETLGLRLRQGRAFADTDNLAGREGAIIDEAFAARFFPNTDPVGRRIRLTTRGDGSGMKAPWLTIVGVAPAIPDFGPPPFRHPLVYVPLTVETMTSRDLSIVVRSQRALAAIVPLLRNELRALDPSMPLYGVEAVSTAAANSRSGQRLAGTVIGSIALIGLALSTIGVYALTAHGVSQRTREIGIRVALGARPAQVVWLFIRQTAIHLAIGLTLGVAGALATARLIGSFLVDVGPRDPLTLTAVVVLLAVVAVVASLLPCRQAARLDPAVAVRAE